jgi:hypothetical protein
MQRSGWTILPGLLLTPLLAQAQQGRYRFMRALFESRWTSGQRETE